MKTLSTLAAAAGNAALNALLQQILIRLRSIERRVGLLESDTGEAGIQYNGEVIQYNGVGIVYNGT